MWVRVAVAMYSGLDRVGSANGWIVLYGVVAVCKGNGVLKWLVYLCELIG